MPSGQERLQSWQARSGTEAGAHAEAEAAERMSLTAKPQTQWKELLWGRRKMNKFCCCSESIKLIELKCQSKFQSTGTQWAAAD